VATDAAGLWFKAHEGGEEGAEGLLRFKGNPFVLLTLNTAKPLGTGIWYRVQSHRMGPPWDTLSRPRHLRPGGGVLRSNALISDHKSS
ncbi:hypothetical protein XENOCAPTIV_021475, partial [Xenoophorus captivus]